ncbi:arylphorin subunit alpha-like, partial [Choristoneura fumiferana]|uniref:arylphorin subunit alpha-like n=1 Tax=Choristoneura fumiferana TaxID=7141 RepID=UPI003D158677
TTLCNTKINWTLTTPNCFSRTPKLTNCDKFDLYGFKIHNDIFATEQELTNSTVSFKVRQPRLNHKSFTVTVNVASEVTTDAIAKLFLGPQFDINGPALSIEANSMNFVELDSFVYQLVPGDNQINGNSEEFFFFKEGVIPVTEINKLLASGKVPVNMVDQKYEIPNRMMLPRGTSGGFPFQICVMV